MKKINNKSILIMWFLITILMLCGNKVFATDTATITVGESQMVDTSETYTTWKSYTVSDASIASIEYETGRDARGNVVYVRNLTVKGLKVGECTITCSGQWEAHGSKGAKTKTITIYVVESPTNLMQQEVDAYTNADLNKLGEDATAKEIKYGILADTNNAKLKEIAKNNINKIKKWKETVDRLISSDRHYAGEKQYGAIQSTLNDIITAHENGTDINQAISNNSQGLESTKDLTDESTDRYITIITGESGSDRTTTNFSDVLDDPENFIPTDSDDGVQKLTDKASVILTIITNIGMIIAVLMCAVLGVKYMLSSIEEKAEYKKDMIPYLVGAFLLFGICTIVKVMQQFGESINNI